MDTEDTPNATADRVTGAHLRPCVTVGFMQERPADDMALVHVPLIWGVEASWQCSDGAWGATWGNSH